MQALGRYTKKVPRWLWYIITMTVEVKLNSSLLLTYRRNNADLSTTARPRRRRPQQTQIFTVFQNVLPVMAYWVSIDRHRPRGASPLPQTNWQSVRHL